MSPSLFNNEYSRGPLYQYWKERGQEEKELRERRVAEARLRSQGHQPLSPVYGPSSNDQYANRAVSGPPTYRRESDEGANSSTSASQPTDILPTYDIATGRRESVTSQASRSSRNSRAGEGESRLLSAKEEKVRLRQLEEQRRQIEDDATMAQTLSAEEAAAQEELAVQGNGKQPERRKSTAGKIGRWLADAATGYTKKQERW